MTLSSSRSIGFAPGSIPLSEILVYCDLVGISEQDDRLEFVEIIQAMDRVVLDYHAKKTERGK